jgi:G3E family GTPase
MGHDANRVPVPMSPARYIMVGGFLGAGKTTAILRMAEAFARRGQRVGLITNDQSVGLVDTTVLASHGFPVEEITGGCFCCRFNSLVDAAERLAAEARPEVFIAEPVGSCTDLRASVSYPLRRMYGSAYTVAPLSVVVDPVRALRALGVEPGRSFTAKVLYVYRKQLEEAGIILINKIDAIEPARVATLREALAREYPQARLFEVSARTSQGMDAWIDVLTHDDSATDTDLDIDYATYGEGEALLGWVNTTVTVAGADFDGNAFVRDIASRVAAALNDDGIEIAHLKMTLTPAGGDSDLVVLNQVRNEDQAELSHTLDGELSRGELIVNLRAEGDPARLAAAVDAATLDAADAQSLVVNPVHSEHFRPGQPNPTHRLTPV